MKNLSTSETLNKMNFKQKMNYLWDYYKVQMIILLVVIIALSVFIYSKATKKDTYCSIAYMTADVKKFDTDFLSDNLNNAVLKNNKKETYIASKFILDNESNSSSYTATPKLTGQLESKNFDIVIVTKKFITDNLSNDMFIDLNTLPGADSLQLSGCTVINDGDSNDKKSVYGISIKDMNLLGKLNLSESEDNYLAVMSDSTHKDADVKTIKELLTK